ncbi:MULTISPECIES: helix-turn-helix transcriptional regulator [Pseudomonas]|uniref:Repressor n=1 Tax=Pseudomonas fulva TaxID=47880 RepID=A0A0D0KCN7_9PSED|nr:MULTISPECIES: helix-turn-helix transcriptional regulator [Pseudomonas]KIP97016.1 repressor [Pseudomonas fulva]
MSYADRLKAIRAAEGVTQAQFSELVGIPHNTVKKLETSRFALGMDSLQKITTHSRFTKYTLWLITGSAVSAAEQVCP